jgi:polyferredoxin
MECVGCTACIDACNGVMKKIDRPLGLIRMASENQIGKGEIFHYNYRMKAYTAILLILVSLMTFLIVTRHSVDATISRVRGQFYQELGTDSLSNLFSAKIINKTRSNIPYKLKLENIQGNIRMTNAGAMILKSESINEVIFFVDIPKSAIKKRSTEIKIGVYNADEDENLEIKKAKFLGPF